MWFRSIQSDAFLKSVEITTTGNLFLFAYSMTSRTVLDASKHPFFSSGTEWVFILENSLNVPSNSEIPL